MQKRILQSLALTFIVLSLSMIAISVQRASANGITGDVNGDGQVNLKDFFAACKAFGATEGTPRYNANADLNHDGVVDMLDLLIIRANFGLSA